MKEKSKGIRRRPNFSPGTTPLIHQLIKNQTKKNPGAIAIEFDSSSLTYAELDARASRLAKLLKSLGAGPERPIALYSDRCLALVIGILGILKAGAAYVPLDPALPRARREFILVDSGATILVTTDTVETLQAGAGLSIVRVDKAGIKPTTDTKSFCRPTRKAVQPDNLAYIMYTSGSTGRPKGVEVTHRSVVNVLDSFSTLPGLTSADTLVAVTTHSFDISALELFLPFSVGAKVVMADRVSRGRGDKLLELLRASKATAMQATPATWHMLLEAGWKNAEGFLAMCGGETLPIDLARDLIGIGCKLWNLYGPTETTIWSTIHAVREVKHPIPIGKPILKTTVLILDEDGEPVTNGDLGEIVIGGVGVARGYLNHPKLTSERFIVRCNSDGQPERFFRTGDFGRRLPDGSIEFAGRADRQVKLQGFRIELGEIEAVLCEHADVLKSVVMVEGEGLDRRLVAYIVPRQNRKISPGEIIEIMRRRLPPYMFVHKLCPVSELPLTPNGKIDRISLAATHHEGGLTLPPAVDVGSCVP